MKLIHISDIHINPDPITGADSAQQFQNVIKHVEANHMDADKIVITGDLTHHGFAESYQALREMLEASKLKDHLKPVLMIGNHDDRQNFATEFPDVVRDKNGFVQSSEETPLGRFVYIDTKQDGTHQGFYCEKRQNWLLEVLDDARTSGEGVWLFMHHNPTSSHVANADQFNLINENEFRMILKRYSDVIRHIFFGHCHYSLSGSVEGIPISAPRSTSHPNWPEFSGDPSREGVGPIARNYHVCFLSEHDVVVHSIDYEIEEDIVWVDYAKLVI